jgi:hypothetical protein
MVLCQKIKPIFSCVLFQVCLVAGLASPNVIPESWPLELAQAAATVACTFILPLVLVCVDPLLRAAARYTFSMRYRSLAIQLPHSLPALRAHADGLGTSKLSLISGMHANMDDQEELRADRSGGLGVCIEEDDVEKIKLAPSPASTVQSNKKTFSACECEDFGAPRVLLFITRKLTCLTNQ